MNVCYVCHEEKSNVTVLEKWRRSSMVRVVCRDCNTERKRKYRQSEHGKRAITEASRRAYKKHRAKWIARSQVRAAIKKGTVTKPTKCENCKETKPLQAHHTDYSKPLVVIFLCSGCHADADKLLTP